METLLLEDIELEETRPLEDLFGDENCRISHLALNSMVMSEATCLNLVESIKRLRSLKKLSFNRNHSTTAVIKQLGTAAQYLNLTSLSLSHCNITDESLRVLNQNLSSKTIEELDLSWNHLTTASCKEMKALLVDMTSLTTLYIQHNSLGGTGFQSLAKALDDHDKLTYLDVSFNKLGNLGFQHIFYPITKNKSQI